jgi:hypothetical protein
MPDTTAVPPVPGQPWGAPPVGDPTAPPVNWASGAPGTVPPAWTPTPGMGDQSWVSATASDKPARHLPIVAIVVVAFIAIGGVITLVSSAGRSDTGEINKAGEIEPADLRVGDCFDLPNDPVASGDIVEKAVAKPCGQPHQYEVFTTGTIDSASGTYPTDDELRAWTKANCVSAFAAYVGMSYDDSVLEMITFYPNEAGWRKSDRQMQCSLEDPGNTALTASQKGAKR